MAKSTSFQRQSAERDSAEEFQFSPLPEFPQSMFNRFPELRDWWEQMKRKDAEDARRLSDALAQLKGR